MKLIPCYCRLGAHILGTGRYVAHFHSPGGGTVQPDFDSAKTITTLPFRPGKTRRKRRK